MTNTDTTAASLDGMLVTTDQVADAGGEYDSGKNCYEFPDGSAGRLITFQVDEPAHQFVELKMGC